MNSGNFKKNFLILQSHDITSILDQRYYNNGRTKPTQGSQISNHHPVITEIELGVEEYDTGGAQKWCFISAQAF